MTATLIKRLVDLAILVLLLAGGLAVVGILAGNMSVTHAVQVAPPALESIGPNATLAFDRGTLSIEGNGVLRAAAIATALAGVALALLALLALRRLLGRFAEGEALSEGAVADLRRIGFLLIGLAVFSVAAELAMQPLLLDTLAPPAGTIVHPSLSWSKEGMRNIWLDTDVPVGTAVLGALALLVAQAFRAGLDYRRDSEGVL